VRRASGIVACLAALTAILIGAPSASAGQSRYEAYVACEYRALWGEELPTHHCQLKMKKAGYFRSNWGDPIYWYYCVRYPATAGDGGHHHRESVASRRLPAHTQCFPDEGSFVAQPGQLYRDWLHSHRRGKHWVYWYVHYTDGWRKVRSWWFTNALHFHI
jgi:hypothetical protein